MYALPACLPACASGAARVSSSIASHGGGSTARLDFLSSSFLELRTHSGWTRLLHQVNLPTEATAGLISPPPGCDSSRAFFLLLNDRFIPPFLCLCVHSEEAKSTTWLHPVSGEAVVTGHRKTPGTVSTTGRLTSLSVQSV